MGLRLEKDITPATAAGRPLKRVTTSLYDILDGIALSLVPEPGPAEGAPA